MSPAVADAPPSTWIGASLRRFEDRRLLIGAGQYVDDVELAGALSLAILHSPYAHARLTRLDVSAARNAPGVLDVVTGADVTELGGVDVMPIVPNVNKPHHPLLVADVARYVGEPVVAILADDPRTAIDTLELVEAEWEPLPVVASVEAALEEGAQLLHAEFGSNLSFETEFGSPPEEVDAAFASADHVVSLRIESPRINPVTMETRAIAVEYLPDQDRFLIHPSHQQTFAARMSAQAVLGLPADKFDVLAQDVGGGFGAKGTPYREEM